MVLGFFNTKAWIVNAEAETEGFNKNTHFTQEFKTWCEAIDKHYNNANKIFGSTQGIAFPFVCEECIVSWEVQAYANEDTVLTDLMGSLQFFQTVSVPFWKLRHKRGVIGCFNIVGMNLNTRTE